MIYLAYLMMAFAVYYIIGLIVIEQLRILKMWWLDVFDLTHVLRWPYAIYIYLTRFKD